MSNYNICKECNKEFNGRKKKYCSKACSDEIRRRQNRERWRRNNKPKPDVTITCEWCGNKHTVPARTAHQARFCSDDCRYKNRERNIYKRIPLEEYNKQRREIRLKRETKLNKVRNERKAIRELIRTLKGVSLDKEKIELTRPCDECGCLFYNPSPIPLTCSKRCSRRRNNRMRKLYESDRLNQSNIIDEDITLKKLYKRDEGICYICGDGCDYEDKYITNEGYFVVGKKYPSIDHVVALSNGGKHSWENVKLAHHYCNTIKRDNLIDNNSKSLV